MNKDIFEGKWKEIRGQIKEWWGELTDDDLERVGGKADQFIGLLQQKYGYTRERAEEEFNRRIKEVKEAIDKVWNSFKDLPQSQAAGWTLNLAIMSYS